MYRLLDITPTATTVLQQILDHTRISLQFQIVDRSLRVVVVFKTFLLKCDNQITTKVW